jgi:uncharacterized membrane protein YhaH (DUF805 family)
MWQDTTRKIKNSGARESRLRFWWIGGLSWVILIVVLSLAGVLAVLFVGSKRS